MAERETAWWALYAARLSGEAAAPVLVSARAQLLAPETPAVLLRPMAYVLLRGDRDGALLDAQLQESPRPAVRAAIACALQTVIPPEMWSRVPVDAEAASAMGDCETPWGVSD